MKKLLKKLLLEAIDKIDAGNCNIDDDECHKVIDMISDFIDENRYLNTYQACRFLGVSRATFDNYIIEGKLKKGIKRAGESSLYYKKSDLNEFIKENKIKNR